MLQETSIKVKPFLKWAGGKTQLLPEIKKTLPAQIPTQKNLTYIEPFVGSGAVMFWFLQNFQHINTAVINDINADLINAYKIIKQQPIELIGLLNELQSSYLPLDEEERKQFFLAKRRNYNERNSGNIEQAAFLIFLNRTCFNGLYRVNSKQKFNVPFGRYANPKICDAENIMAVSSLLQKVTLLQGDYQQTLDYAGKHSFFYFDPPYKPLNKTSSFNAYANEVFNDEQQEKLASFCRKIDKEGHRFLLSNSDMKNENDDDHYFDKLYEGFNIKRVKARRMINSKSDKRGEIDEILICNY